LGKDVKYCKIIPGWWMWWMGLFMGFSAPCVKSLRLPWQQQRTTFLAEQIVCHAQLVHSSRPDPGSSAIWNSAGDYASAPTTTRNRTISWWPFWAASNKGV
jgi:hypothetical protein